MTTPATTPALEGRQANYATPPGPITTGGTVRPIYGERRPVMYHLFETEMISISAFNTETLRWFAIGSLLVNCVLAIVVDYAYATTPLSEFGAFCLHKAAPILSALTLAAFGFGFWVLREKKRLIDQIKQETRTESPSLVS